MKGVNIITAFSSNVILRLLFIYPCLKVPAMSEAKSVPPGSEECAGERSDEQGGARVKRGREMLDIALAIASLRSSLRSFSNLTLASLMSSSCERRTCCISYRGERHSNE